MIPSHGPATRLGRGVLALALLAAGCRPADSSRNASFGTMGSVATVIAAGPDSSRVQDYAAIAESAMRDIDEALSLYKTNSQVCRLNALAGSGQGVVLTPHLRANLELARRYGELSGGAFDVTVGPLVRLWGFSGGATPADVVADRAIEQARRRVGYGGIRMDGGQAWLERDGMVVDLGGVAKGYAVDVCCALLRARGAQNFTVDLSGNMRCFGRPSPERSWCVGVRDPFHPGEVLGTLELGDGQSVSTSGNYERYVRLGGHRYGHIIDPRTGRPVEGMAGVTVVAPLAADADALSTALFVLGMEEGSRLVARVTDSCALFVPDREPVEIHITPGMRRLFHPLPSYATRVRRTGP